MADTQTIQSTTAPWSPLQPYLQTGFSEAARLYGLGGPSYYPNSTVAQFGGDTNNALNLFRQRAQQGSPVAGAAGNLVTGTLQGDYLNSNPYLDSMYDRAAGAVTRNYQEAVAPSIAAKFGMSGRTGGNAAFGTAMDSSRDQLGRTLEGLASNIYGQNYANERNLQLQAANMAPQIGQLGYLDANQLLNVGNLMDTKSQQNIDDSFNRYMYQQQQPYENLGRYFGYLGGNYGSQSTQQQPIYQNSLAQNLGLGLTGLGVLNSVGGLSGLGGLFGL